MAGAHAQGLLQAASGPLRATFDLAAFGASDMVARTELCGPDLSAANSAEKPDAVRPAAVRVARGDAGRFAVTLKPASWNVLRFRVGRAATRAG